MKTCPICQKEVSGHVSKVYCNDQCKYISSSRRWVAAHPDYHPAYYLKHKDKYRERYLKSKEEKSKQNKITLQEVLQIWKDNIMAELKAYIDTRLV